MPLRLPEKNRYSLNDLASEWECTEDNVLNLGIDSYLVISAFARDCPVEFGFWEESEYWRGAGEYGNVSGLFSVWAPDLLRIL